MASYKKRIADILFLDIETAGGSARFSDLSENMKELWSIKAKQLKRGEELSIEAVAQLYLDKGAIFSEFSRVVCISVGYFDYGKQKTKKFRVKSFFGDNEKEILSHFISLLKAHFDRPNKQAIAGHNIKEFDIPFLCRRMIIHGLKVPKMLDIKGKKPWQVNHLLDTLVLWRFGDYKNYTSLKLLAAVLGIPSPKNDIDGSQIHDTYWNKNDLKRICEYCERDVLTTAKVFLRIHNKQIPENLEVISKTRY